MNDSDAKRARPRLARLKDQRESEELFLKGLARGNGLSVSIIPARTVQDERVGGVRSQFASKSACSAQCLPAKHIT